jgi:hypothetical protein
VQITRLFTTFTWMTVASTVIASGLLDATAAQPYTLHRQPRAAAATASLSVLIVCCVVPDHMPLYRQAVWFEWISWITPVFAIA